MSDLTVPKGDYGYNLNFTVQDDAGVAYNLTGYTVTLKVWYKGTQTNPILSGTCVIDVAANGTCHYTVLTTNFAQVGNYLIELQLTKAGVIESTRYYTLRVEESP